MNAILDWFNPTRWIILGVMLITLAASVLGYGAWCAHEATAAEKQRWELAIDRQKVEAAGKLAVQTRKVLDLERQLGAARAAQEKTDAENAKTVADLRADLRRNSRAAGGPGLRDPFAGRGGGSGGTTGPATASADAGAADQAKTSGVLSAGFENLLLDWAADADTINEAYASCRADSQAVRAPP